MKDLGEARNCLGLEISRNRQTGQIFISQKKHIQELLTKYNMVDCNVISTLFDAGQKLTKDMSPKTAEDVDFMKNIPYQQAVGSPLYIAQGSRPDIAFSVNTVSKFKMNPGKAHTHSEENNAISEGHHEC